MLTIKISGVTITVPPGNSVVIHRDGQIIASFDEAFEPSHATETLMAALRRLHMDAGAPSTRTIAQNANGAISHDTVHKILTGKQMPKWKTLSLFVQALGGNAAYFKELWLAATERNPTNAGTDRSVT